MELHTAALFLHDDAGRITGTNDGEPPGTAPRLYLGRSRAGNVWRFRVDLAKGLATELEGILESEPPASDLRQAPETLSRLRATLAKVGPEESVDMGPTFRFPLDIPEPTGVEMIHLSNLDLVQKHFPGHYPWLADEFSIRQPITAIVRHGAAVSICFSARMTTEAAEAGVDTTEAFRGQGFAAQVTSAWATAIRGMGRLPLYSTSWNNTASQRVASKLGLIMYGSEMSIY